MKFLDTILDFLFPRKCLFCGQKDKEICLKCLSEFPVSDRQTAKWIFCLYDYQNPLVKKSLWLLKYNHQKQLAKIFAEILYGKIMEELSELSIMENFKESLLIPIPISENRKKERGYNQSKLIAEELFKIEKANTQTTELKSFILNNNILYRKNIYERQAKIKNRTERLKNIIGTFSLNNKEEIQNKNIILIDDIVTTGATLEEAKKILLENGARKIIAFTVAH